MNTPTIKVLLIDDDEDDYILTRDLLADVKIGKYALDWASSYEEGLEVVGRREHHVCLVDYRLGERSGVQLIREAWRARVSTPMILLTGQGNHEVDVEAMQAGATDYLVKDKTPTALLERTLRYAVELNTERCRSEEALGLYVQKQAAVAHIGSLALSGGELGHLLAESVSLIARTLDVQFCKVVEFMPGGEALILSAGVGWKEEYAVGPVSESQARFTLSSGESVIVDDWRTEMRFEPSPLLQAHGIVSGVSVIIGGRERPFGVLSVHTAAKRKFGSDEVSFLNSIANVLAEAIARKRSEDEIKQSEARFRRVVESNMVGIIFWDVSGKITGANDAFFKMVGFTREDLTAGRMDWTEMTPPEYRPLDEKALAEVVAAGVCETYEKEFICKNGSRISILIGASTLTRNGPNGVAFVLDISDRKKAERILKKSEMRMSEAQAIAHLGSWECDVLTNQIHWSEEHYRIFGLDPRTSDLSIESTIAYIHPEDQNLVRQAIAQALESKVFSDLEYRVQRPDGTIAVVQAHGSVIVDDSGRVIKMAGTAHDITQRKRAEEESTRLNARMESQRLRLDSIVATVPGVVWEAGGGPERPTDTNFVSEHVKTMLGYSVEEWHSTPDFWFSIVHPDDKERTARAAAVAFAAGKSSNTLEFRWVAKDGHVIWVESQYAIILDDEGRPRGSRGVTIDVTERKKLEGQLRQAQKMEAIGTLAGGIAHDFNNILGAIMGYSELAQMDVAPDSRGQAHLAQVLSASARAKDLVRQILTFSRQEELEREALQLQPVIDETLKLLRASLPSTIQIRQDIDPIAPPIIGNWTQIQQVIMNLCTNAGQAMNERGGNLEIRLTALDIDQDFASGHPQLRAGPHVCLEVRDDGSGMDRATQERIFEPFFTTKEQGKGTGLGLAVVHGVVENHGGAIVVSSEPGVGTTFSIYLPVYGLRPEPVVLKSDPMPRGNDEHILFVDDEEDLVSVGKSMLEHLGYRVTARSDSVEALAIFQSQPQEFDLVITDQTMPLLNGADLARQMLQIRPALPVILTTGYSSTISPEGAKAIGIRELLLKPYTMRLLGDAIRRPLDETGRN